MTQAMTLSVEELLSGPMGSAAPPLTAEEVRPLVAEDLLALAEPRGVQPSALKRVRTIHHQIAQQLATGMRPMEVAAATGYSFSRISILQNDPLFQELMVFYSDQEVERFAELQDQIKSLGQAATEELMERVSSEEVVTMSHRDLTKIAEMSLDRSGHSPVRKKESLRVVLTAEELKDLKGQVNARRTDRIIEATPEALEALPDNSGPGVGGDLVDGAAGPDAEKIERSAGSG